MTTSAHSRLRFLWAFALVLVFVAGFPLHASAQQRDLPQHFRPYDQRGINVFEPTKVDTTVYHGFDFFWGAAFAQQFQALDHSNEAEPVMDDNGTNVNELVDLGAGFNTATANLLLGAQLADGIQVNVLTYLSSRHHPEAWVKGGFLQVDRLPMLRSQALDNLMKVVTLRVGHFEINYGDAHFRRTDNGMAMYNPFVGNYVMDAFTTEIGGEVYVQSSGLLGMLGITGGEIRGNVTDPEKRALSVYGKLGYDGQVTPDLRVRLTGSAYTTAKSANNTLYGGDRAGSRYYDVLVHSAGASFTNGRVNPGFRDEVTSFVLNPFVKYRGLELFGIVEQSAGRASFESEDRTWSQYAVEGVYRFLPREQVFVGARYNTVEGELAGSAADVSINRIQIGAGWFPTHNILAKVEYVSQSYNDYAPTDILHEAEFNGFVVEGVVAF